MESDVEFFFQALTSPYGIVLETDLEGKSLVTRLLIARKRYIDETGDTSVLATTVRLSPTTPNQVWIIRRRQEQINGSTETSP